MTANATRANGTHAAVIGHARVIQGTSVMAAQVRAFDWSSTPLGAMDDWSPILLTQVNLMLASPVPTTLAWGPDRVFLFNDAARSTLGPRHVTALGRRCCEVFEESWNLVKKELDDCFLSGATITREDVMISFPVDGRTEPSYYSSSLVPIYEEGRIVGVQGLNQNITQNVLALAERDALARQLAQILDSTSDGIVGIDRQWRVTYLNGRALEILDVEETVLGLPVWTSFGRHFLCAPQFKRIYERAMLEGIPGTAEAFCPENSETFLHLEARPSLDGIVVFLRDLTREKRADELVRRGDEREARHLRELFQQAPAFIAVVGGPEHRFEMVNHSYQNLLADRARLGEKVADCVPEVVAAGWIDLLDHVYRTGKPHAAIGAVLSLVRKPGEQPEDRFVDCVYQPRCEPDGSVSGIIVLGIDVTDKKRTEQALIQNEKLVAVGRLASSIAHEINNPLGAALNYLHLVGLSHSVDEMHEFAATAERELRRVSVISSQTLLSQKNFGTKGAVALQDILEGVLSLYQGRIENKQVEIRKDFRSRELVLCNEGEIRQVFGNLVGNALEAMAIAGGRLTLRTSRATDWKTGRSGHKVSIADTGEGIPGAIRAKVFEPFFTTKGSLGNGLGLWVCKEIVERYQGVIAVKSSQHGAWKGTLFTIFLPAS